MLFLIPSPQYIFLQKKSKRDRALFSFCWQGFHRKLETMLPLPFPPSYLFSKYQFHSLYKPLTDPVSINLQRKPGYRGWWNRFMGSLNVYKHGLCFLGIDKGTEQTDGQSFQKSTKIIKRPLCVSSAERRWKRGWRADGGIKCLTAKVQGYSVHDIVVLCFYINSQPHKIRRISTTQVFFIRQSKRTVPRETLSQHNCKPSRPE